MRWRGLLEIGNNRRARTSGCRFPLPPHRREGLDISAAGAGLGALKVRISVSLKEPISLTARVEIAAVGTAAAKFQESSKERGRFQAGEA